ncbi:unnamed protein product [Mytilus coruscus]|uniref:PHD-type domain-containing protein n=1 Tax=Mytilus coruscus TaxID=42192 RepID=A0A6J8E9L4_MYTCO|nr:unnamed protein product [Mytilus coruscus]
MNMLTILYYFVIIATIFIEKKHPNVVENEKISKVNEYSISTNGINSNTDMTHMNTVTCVVIENLQNQFHCSLSFMFEITSNLKYLHNMHVYLSIQNTIYKMAKQDPRWTKLKPSKMLLFFLLLMIMKSNDIQTNPGPSNDSTKYLCGTCDQSVNLDHKGIVCQTCDQWFHINCQGIHSKSYEDLNDSRISWHCIICDKPNYSTVLFDLHSIDSPNSFASLDIGDINHSNPPSSPDYHNQNIKPLHASTLIRKKTRESSFN